MSELGTSSPEFAKMTPEELNIEFLDLLDQIPQEPTNGRGVRRRKNEQDNWRQKLQSLLSRSQITHSFRAFITDDLDRQYISGIRTTEPWRQLYWPDLGGGGIFDKKQGQMLDREVYRYLFDEYRTALELIQNDRSNSAPPNPLPATRQELLKTWRREFIERYRDEP